VAVRLRLRRAGKKKMPVYHIVAADSRAARSGKVLEVVGRYDPHQNPPVVTNKETRVFYWLKNGALPTDTVRSLFQRSGLWMKWSMMKRGKDEAFIATEMEKWQMAQAEKQQRNVDRKVRQAAARKAKKKTEGEGAAAPAAPAPPAAEATPQA
jgi:small subunit ribosomal protein S16